MDRYWCLYVVGGRGIGDLGVVVVVDFDLVYRIFYFSTCR